MNRRSLIAACLTLPLLQAVTAFAQDTLAGDQVRRQDPLAIEFGRPPWGYKDSSLTPTGSDYEQPPTPLRWWPQPPTVADEAPNTGTAWSTLLRLRASRKATVRDVL